MIKTMGAVESPFSRLLKEACELIRSSTKAEKPQASQAPVGDIAFLSLMMLLIQEMSVFHQVVPNFALSEKQGKDSGEVAKAG